MMTVLYILFWICAAVVFYTFAGYGILLWIIVKVKELLHPAKKQPVQEEYPDVTLLMAAYNEEDCIEDKMANCRALDYPADKLHIVWVTDGSTDRTPELLRTYPENTVLHEDARGGKTAALNRAMEYVHTPFVVMTDANTELNPECISLIVREFDDPKVGCVSGEKRVRKEGRNAADTEGFYWRYESKLKELDSRLYSAMGAAGELCAIRRDLWTPIPTEMIFDDMFISMDIVRRGYKIAYCKEAYASETPSADIREERKRKVRLAAGGLQITFRLRELMNPFRHGVVAFQFFSHRALRWVVTPSAILLTLLLNIALVCLGAPMFYRIVLALQILFYLCALVGMVQDKKGVKSKFSIPYYFLFANFSTFPGWRYYFKSKGAAIWERAKRA